MGIENLSVIYDNGNNNFNSCDLVQGEMQFNVTSTEKFKQILIKLRGKGWVHWTETEYEDGLLFITIYLIS